MKTKMIPQEITASSSCSIGQKAPVATYVRKHYMVRLYPDEPGPIV